MTTPPATPRWLLLAHQLPTRSSNARVKTWRRLQQLGAVPARNSVYVLPNTAQCREDFEWIRSEILVLGGEATVFAADVVNQDAADDIVAAFVRARDADYLALERDAGHLAARIRPSRSSPRDAVARAVRSLRERLHDVQRVDFFHAKNGQAAAEAVEALERRLAGPPAAPKEADVRFSTKDFANRRWVTRPRPGVDRMASAWLIRRFIDPRATFGFVDRARGTEVPFDMYDGDFSHQGQLCTFETLARQFGLAGAVVDPIGQIVHDLDLKETRYAAPEAPAVGRMVEGLRQLHPDDATLLEQGLAMFEALARSFESSAPPRRRAAGTARAPRKPKRKRQ
jgi:hypothetical protein